MRQGCFITLEGGEGSGKSTQRAALAALLRGEGREVVETREPGGSPGAEAIRSLFVLGDPERWDPVTEAFLVFAARRDHVQRLILPALTRGAWVICDRFADSTYAYQGYGHRVELEALHSLNQFAVGDLTPDLTLLLDLPVEEGLSRALERGDEQRFETLGRKFHHRVREGYLKMAVAEPERFALIDASQPVGQVTRAISRALEEKLGLRL